MSTEVMDYLPQIILAAKKAAGVLAEHFYRAAAHTISLKKDQTPVTQADMAANQIITAELEKIDPRIPVLSEENPIPDFQARSQWKQYWLIDPLDGTRGFIKRSNEFCINIALVENHRPVMGLIYAPISNEYCYASKNTGVFWVDEKNQYSKKIEKTVRDVSDQKTTRFLTGHFDRLFQFEKRLTQFRDTFGSVQIRQMNSALKFTALALGQADVYLRMGQTSEWDTAAGQCILEEIGGAVVDFQGQPLQYNAKPSLLNTSFVAVSDLQQLQKCLELLR